VITFVDVSSERKAEVAVRHDVHWTAGVATEGVGLSVGDARLRLSDDQFGRLLEAMKSFAAVRDEGGPKSAQTDAELVIVR